MKGTGFTGLLLVYLLTMALPALAGEALPFEIGLLEDADAEWALADITAAPLAARFVAVDGASVNLGYARSAWWLRLDPVAPIPADRLLEIAYTQIDRLDLHLPTSDGWQHIRAGDTRPRPPELIEHPTPLVELPEGMLRPLYIRVASSGSVVLPIRVHQKTELLRQAVMGQFGFGFYYAVLAAMAIYNSFLFAAIQDRSYLYYVLYLAGLLVFQGSLFGHATLWLWPQWPAWANLATVTGVAVMIAAGAAFVMRLAQTRCRVPWGHRALQALTIAALAILPLMLIDYRSAVMAVTALGAVAVMLIYPLPVILSYVRGCRQARFLVLGLVLFLPGVALIAMRTMGLIPPSWWSEHILQVGTAAEAMLFSFALADRINALSAEKLAAQQAVVSAHDGERRRIAADLHDSLGQNLLLLSNRLQRQADQVPDAAELRETVNDSLTELRSTVRHLHPHQLDRLGIRRSLESMLEDSLTGVGIELERQLDPPELTPEQELQIYRIAQEAVSNILRHSGASRACVRLTTNRRHLELEIIDNGKGLDPANRDNEGLGLAGMRSRAEILGGRIDIQSTGEQGTRIHLIAPLHHG